MISLITFNLPILIVAFLVGVATTRWVKRRHAPKIERSDT